MKHLKKFSILAITALFFVTLPGCSSSDPKPRKPKREKMSVWKKTACVLRLRYKGCYDWLHKRAEGEKR